MDHLEPFFRCIINLSAILWMSLVGLLQWFIPRSLYAKDVSNDIILITGAGSGLGRQIAIEFAKLNSSLVLWDINERGLRETQALVELEFKKRVGKSGKQMDDPILAQKSRDSSRFCKIYVTDVSNREDVYARASEVHTDLNVDNDLSQNSEKYVSVLINNAGIYHGKYLSELKDEQIERIFKINIISHFWTVRAFLPKMIEHQKGHIVEIASMGGINGMLKQVDYCATKFGAVGFEESLSLELDALGLGDKIHTTAVCPLFFKSNLFTGYNSKAAPIMSCNYVAKETVWAMRCNHARALLPPSANILYLLRPITTRKALCLWTRVLGYDEGIKEIKGAAAAISLNR